MSASSSDRHPTSSSARCVKLMACLYCVLTRNSLSAKGWYRSTRVLMVKKLPRLLLIFSLSTAARNRPMHLKRSPAVLGGRWAALGSQCDEERPAGWKWLCQLWTEHMFAMARAWCACAAIRAGFATGQQSTSQENVSKAQVACCHFKVSLAIGSPAARCRSASIWCPAHH